MAIAASATLRRRGAFAAVAQAFAFPGRTRTVAVPIAVAGALLLLYAIVSGGLIGFGAALLLAAAAAAEAFPVPIEGIVADAGTTSFSTVFIAAAAALYDWRTAAVVGGVAIAIPEAAKLGRGNKPPMVLFNVALYTLAAAAAAAASTQHFGLAACTVFYIVDVGLLATVLARFKNEAWLPTVLAFFKSTFFPFAMMASLTILVVVVAAQNPLWVMALLLPMGTMIVYQRRQAGTATLQRALVAQQQLAAELQADFITTVSHELRTPLTAIYGGALTLGRRWASLEEQTRQALVDAISTESARLHAMLDDVLWTSRLDAGSGIVKIVALDPRPIIEKVVNLEQRTSQAATEVEERRSDVDSVLADGEYLNRILLNLVDNAVKYSPDGGLITVSCDNYDGNSRFVVADHGLGIAEEDRARVFDKFVRLDPGQRNGISGTGLGLHIVEAMVKDLNGSIWIETNQPQGTRFVFELPNR